MAEDMSSEKLRKDLAEKMAKDTSGRCQTDCQKVCQKECQKIYVRQNLRKYVPSLCAHTDLDNKRSCLHQWNLVDGILFFVLFGILQQVLLAQLCFFARK